MNEDNSLSYFPVFPLIFLLRYQPLPFKHRKMTENWCPKCSIKVFTNKKNEICLSVCLSVWLYVPPCVDVSGWYFKYWSGTFFRKHRHKSNKKVAVIYEKTVKNRPLPGYLPPSCHGAYTLKMRFPTCVVRTRTYLTWKAITHAHIFDAEGFARKRSGGLPLGRWPCMIGLRVRETDEKQT